MRKKVTMQDIADRLNISKNSVSQALSGKPGVSEETRQRVIQMAKELGYTYSNNKFLNKDKPKNIALIASNHTFSLKSFFGEIYLNVEREINRRGYTLLIQSINEDYKDQLILPPIIKNNQIDGIIVLSHISSEYINMVIETGIPTVVIDHHYPNMKADAVLTNNRFGAFTAIEHLIKLGHSDIAFVGNINYSPSYYERLEGYLLAFHQYNLKVDPQFLFTDALETENYIKSLINRLKKHPTAWFCVNDGLGYLINTQLQQYNVKVPDMASVCSYDNGQLSKISTPKITTMDINLDYFARRSVEQLLWRMEHPHEPFQEILLPSKLIQRESTSVPPK
jgi:LacI family transcriptional regulator